jgi:hypothetical protein
VIEDITGEQDAVHVVAAGRVQNRAQIGEVVIHSLADVEVGRVE